MPEVTVSLPAAMGLILLLLAVGAGMVYFAMRQTPTQAAAEPATVTATVTLTPTPSLSPTPVTPTVTNTPLPSATPQVYSVKEGDMCGSIAASFKVSITSIVLLNPQLNAECTNLIPGDKLLIPQPTPTATALPTSTLSPPELTEQACEKVEYVVKANDTLGSIAGNYAVSQEAIKEYNGMVNDFVRLDQKLVIPLCRREATPGPSPTPTPPPPYPAPNLLLPADGQPFTAADESVTLQWASVGALRDNERYAVTVLDVTAGNDRKLVEYVVDTKFIIPVSFRPVDGMAHILRWSVLTVRQSGTDEEGNPIWEPAGAVSIARDFSWIGSGAPAEATPTP